MKDLQGNHGRPLKCHVGNSTPTHGRLPLFRKCHGLQPHFMASFLWEMNTREGSRSAMVGISNKQTCQIHKSPCFLPALGIAGASWSPMAQSSSPWSGSYGSADCANTSSMRSGIGSSKLRDTCRQGWQQGKGWCNWLLHLKKYMALSENRGCPLSWPMIETWLSQATILDVSQDAKRQTMANHDKPKYIHKRVINEQPISI